MDCDCSDELLGAQARLLGQPIQLARANLHQNTQGKPSYVITLHCVAPQHDDALRADAGRGNHFWRNARRRGQTHRGAPVRAIRPHSARPPRPHPQHARVRLPQVRAVSPKPQLRLVSSHNRRVLKSTHIHLCQSRCMFTVTFLSLNWNF